MIIILVLKFQSSKSLDVTEPSQVAFLRLQTELFWHPFILKINVFLYRIMSWWALWPTWKNRAGLASHFVQCYFNVLLQGLCSLGCTTSTFIGILSPSPNCPSSKHDCCSLLHLHQDPAYIHPSYMHTYIHTHAYKIDWRNLLSQQ